MCGRFTLRASAVQLADFFRLHGPVELVPRYNIAPTQQVLIIRSTVEGRSISHVRWGLVPSWADDLKIGASLINARSETAAQKPSFRAAFKKRRCLIPCDGFYEWEAVPGRKLKQPWLITLLDQPLFAFAGLWETWHAPDGEAIDTCSILTTQSNELLRPLHDRMPVILEPHDHEPWLSTPPENAESLQPLLRQYPAPSMTRRPVSTVVNSARNERAECIEAADLSG